MDFIIPKLVYPGAPDCTLILRVGWELEYVWHILFFKKWKWLFMKTLVRTLPVHIVCSNGRRYENDLSCFQDSEIMLCFFNRWISPEVAIHCKLQTLAKYLFSFFFFFLHWKSRLQSCLANLKALLASQRPLAWMFAWACHRHCNRQNFTLTFSTECISFQSR